MQLNHAADESVEHLHANAWSLLKDWFAEVFDQFFCTSRTHLVDADEVLHRVDVVDVCHGSV